MPNCFQLIDKETGVAEKLAVIDDKMRVALVCTQVALPRYAIQTIPPVKPMHPSVLRPPTRH